MFCIAPSSSLHTPPSSPPHFSFLSPLKQVAIEAMDKKMFDLSSTVQMDPPDLKRLQLLLQGSISTQARAKKFSRGGNINTSWTTLCVCMCARACVHACMWVCGCVRVCMRVCVCVRVSVCPSICLSVFLDACLAVCVALLPAFGKTMSRGWPEIFVLHGYSEMILTSHNLVLASQLVIYFNYISSLAGQPRSTGVHHLPP